MFNSVLLFFLEVIRNLLWKTCPFKEKKNRKAQVDALHFAPPKEMNAFGKSLCLGNDAWLAIGHVLEINAPTALTTSGLENNLTCTFMYMCKGLPFHLFALHFSFSL